MEKNTVKICSICGKPYVGYGNNAAPINDGRCCDECNGKVVMARMFIDRLINTEAPTGGTTETHKTVVVE